MRGPQKRRGWCGLAVMLALLLAACGGGSGGAGGVAVDSSTVAVAASVDLASSDGVGGVGGGDGGGDGSAGDGELIRLAVDFTNLRGTWTVTASAYGITGQSGAFTLVKDAANGGYRFVGGRTPQENLRVSNDGHVTGSLPLVIGGSERASRFLVPLKTVASPALASLAGRYNIAYVEQDPSDVNVTRTGTFATTAATMQVASNGSFAVCPFADYSVTCANRITGAFALSPNPKVLDVTWNGATDGKAEVTAGKSIDSLVWDFQTKNAAGTVVRTGARFAARIQSKLVDSDYYGAWDFIGKAGANVYGDSVFPTSWTSSSSGPFVFPTVPSRVTQTVYEPGQSYTATANVQAFSGTNSLPVVSFATTRKRLGSVPNGRQGHYCDAIYGYVQAAGNIQGSYGSIAETLSLGTHSYTSTATVQGNSVLTTVNELDFGTEVLSYFLLPLSQNLMVFVQVSPLKTIVPRTNVQRETLSGPAAVTTCGASTCYRQNKFVNFSGTAMEYSLLRRTKTHRVADFCS